MFYCNRWARYSELLGIYSSGLKLETTFLATESGSTSLFEQKSLGLNSQLRSFQNCAVQFSKQKYSKLKESRTIRDTYLRPGIQEPVVY